MTISSLYIYWLLTPTNFLCKLAQPEFITMYQCKLCHGSYNLRTLFFIYYLHNKSFAIMTHTYTHTHTSWDSIWLRHRIKLAVDLFRIIITRLQESVTTRFKRDRYQQVGHRALPQLIDLCLANIYIYIWNFHSACRSIVRLPPEHHIRFIVWPQQSLITQASNYTTV